MIGLTNDSALVAVDGSSGARDVLLDDIQGKDDDGRVDRRTDPEGDLPGQQGGEERGRRERDERVATQEVAHVVAEGSVVWRLRRRKGEQVRQIRGHPPPGPLGRPLVHNHGRSEPS